VPVPVPRSPAAAWRSRPPTWWSGCCRSARSGSGWCRCPSPRASGWPTTTAC
jgi:hypothetical protein